MKLTAAGNAKRYAANAVKLLTADITVYEPC